MLLLEILDIIYYQYNNLLFILQVKVLIGRQLNQYNCLIAILLRSRQDSASSLLLEHFIFNNTYYVFIRLVSM